jgi:hypothetical protein
MKTKAFLFLFFTIASGAMAAPPEVKPTLAVCKVDLKEWSQQKTDTLTITQLNQRMNIMFARADLSKKDEKQVRAYLGEFYRTHIELANRAFDFITRHGLSEQFGAEENGISANHVPPNACTQEQ